MNVTDEIKSHVDIIDMINRYVPLKKAGRNYKGLCPFHGEKTPSFVVFPETGTWRCFGCGRGGDVFTFLMEHEGWDFKEALRVLAEETGVQLKPLTPEQEEAQQNRERLLGLLDAAAEYYLRWLLKGRDAEHARGYVRGRGLTGETAREFQIGYAPSGWTVASDHLQGLGYSADDLLDAGLLVELENGLTYDRFRNRIVIPIRDPRGNVVGFGARTLEKDGKPKYLNSPQSTLFDKSSLLYGFSHARRSIRESETAVIVEGYMDVLQAHQAGFSNVVAQMGTALTEPQLKLLARYASRLILALDPDAAGQMATRRGLEAIERVSKSAAEEATEAGVWDFDSAEREFRAHRSMEFDASGMVRYENDLGFDIRVAVLPEGQDPDDIIREDPEMWEELIEDAVPIVEYVIDTAVQGQNLDDPKVKSRITSEVLPLINNVADSVERSYYRQRLARLLKVPETAFFEKAPPKPVEPKRRKPQAPEPQPLPSEEQTTDALFTPTASREAWCLAALLRDHTLMYKVNRVFAEHFALEDELGDAYYDALEALPEALAREVIPPDFAHPDYRSIFAMWRTALGQDEEDYVDYLLRRLPMDLNQQVIEWFNRPVYAPRDGVRPVDKRLHPEHIFRRLVHELLELRKMRLSAFWQELVLLLQDMDNGGSQAAVDDYLITIKAVNSARRRIEQAQNAYRLSARIDG